MALEQRKDGTRQDAPQGIWRRTAPGDVAVVPELGLPLKLWLKPERMPAGMTIDSLKDDENPGDEICAGMGDVLGPLIGDIMLLGGRFWNGCPGLLGGPSRNAGGGRLFLRPGLPDGPFWNARGGQAIPLHEAARMPVNSPAVCACVCARVSQTRAEGAAEYLDGEYGIS